MGARGIALAALLLLTGCAPATALPVTVRPAAEAAVSRPAVTATTPPAATGTRQLVVVSAATYAATLATYEKVGGTWRPALGAMPARIGGAGFTDHKVEGDGKTPTGVYRIGTTMYGIAPDPGVRYRYHRLVPGDYWNENPGTAGYNSFVHGADPGAGSEALWRISPQYTYLAVIEYNVPA